MEAGSYLRLIHFVSPSLRLKDLLGPVTRVKKKKNMEVHRCRVCGAELRVSNLKARDSGFGIQSLGPRVWGLGFRVWGFGLRV